MMVKLWKPHRGYFEKLLCFNETAHGILRCIFFNGNVWISIEISLKFVPKGPIDNKPNRRQAITWTNEDQVENAYLCHPASMSYNKKS